MPAPIRPSPTIPSCIGVSVGMCSPGDRKLKSCDEDRILCADAGATRWCERLPVRPRRRADADREGARRRLEVRCSTSSWRRGLGAHGEQFVPFDKVDDYDDYVDGKPRYDGVRSFLQSRGIELPQGTPDDPPDAETIDGLGNRKNELVLKLIHEQGVEPYEGSVRYVQRRDRRGLQRAVVSSSTNCQDVLHAAGIDDLFDAIVDGVVAEREHLQGKPAPDTYLAGARALGAEPEARGRVRGRAGRASRRAGPGRSAFVVGVDRVGQAEALRAHGADVVVKDLAELLEATQVIHHPAFAVEPWALRETALDLERLAQTESVFALSNGHLGLRGEPRRGRAVRAPRARTWRASTRFVRCRTPRPATAIRRTARRSSTSPTASSSGCWSRTSRSTSATASSAATSACSICARACYGGRPSGSRRPGPAVRVRSTRLVSFAQRAVAAIHYEVEPLDGNAAGGRAVRARRERVAADDEQATPARPPRWRRRWWPQFDGADDLAGGCSCTRRRSASLTVGAAMDHVVEGPDGIGTTVECVRRPGARHAQRHVEPGKPLRLSSSSPTGGRSERTVPAVRDQVAAGVAGREHTRLGRPARGRSASYLDDFWDARRRRDRGRRRAPAGGPLRAVPHAPGRAPAASGGAIPAKGLTGPGYDGHTFWDTEGFVLPVLTYTAPRAAADALRWRHSTLDLARERARSLGLAGRRFPWRTIHGEECSGVLARGYRRVPHQRRRSPPRCCATAS